MNPNTNHWQYWNDEPNWEHQSEAGNPARAKICLAQLEKDNAELNDYPPGFEDDWEEVKQYHLCYYCHEQGHEEGMLRNNMGYWVHACCQEHLENTIKNIKP
jgi:hypothetical protein